MHPLRPIFLSAWPGVALPELYPIYTLACASTLLPTTLLLQRWCWPP